jgi:hypothetical protein
MVAQCGTVHEVRSSAHKTCAFLAGMRSMDAAVHLRGVRCDGSAHGGCRSRCSLFWKDAWLEPAARRDARPPGHDSADLQRKAEGSLRLRGRDPGLGAYGCQSTELAAATVPLSALSPRQYWDDVRSGNETPTTLLRGLPALLFNRVQEFGSRVLPPALRFRGGRLHPNIVGSCTATPDVRLGLEPGEVAEVRSHAEILATVDASGCNRGLRFDYDMVRYCGRRAVVRHRVDVRIDEQTGELVRMQNPCVVLDGLVCRGRYHRFCPRALDCYWREAWLRRVEADT